MTGPQEPQNPYDPHAGQRPQEPPRAPAALNLNTLEREGGPKLPFDFDLGDKRYILSDPQEVDWQDLLLSMNNPVSFFRIVLPPDDHVSFFSTKLATWKMNVLMRQYQEHYGLPTGPEAAGLPR